MSRLQQASTLDEFRTSVEGRLGADAVTVDGLHRFEVDGDMPELVVTPANAGDVAVALSEARACDLAVIPIGGAAHLGTGNMPEAYDIALSTARLDRIVAHEPADLTVTVEAGVTLKSLQQLLAKNDQALPLDPPCDDTATIGGILAANASGPMRHAFGTARDWLIGLRVAQVDGTLVKSGGRVVKNVTGYDMGKLYLGSLGSLGVIVEATFKVAAVAQEQTTLAAICESAASAASFAMQASDAGLALHGLELLSPPAANAVTGDERWTVLASVAGRRASVRRSIDDLTSLANQQQLSIRTDATACWEAWYEAFRPGLLSVRVSVLPTAVGAAIEVLDRALAGSGALLSATVSAGVIRVQMRPTHEARAAALVERAGAVAERYGGFIVVDTAPATFKRRHDVFGPLRSDFAIMRRLKEEFDPSRTLSPGRFWGKL